MSNKQQTAVEWYDNQLRKVFSNTTQASNFSHEELLQQAKEMEKQKTINDFVAGNKLEFYDGTEKECAEQYYEQTYGGNK
jgi:hypothetical protein